MRDRQTYTQHPDIYTLYFIFLIATITNKSMFVQ